MLSRCLVAVGLGPPLARAVGIPGVSGRPAPRYRKLSSPVFVPLQSISEVWRPAPFSARCRRPDSARSSGSTVLLKGILLRVPVSQPARSDPGLRAFSLMCPHELCDLNLEEDTRLLRLAPEARRNHPVLVCPCHFSVFDPLADGAAISGPAARGAYRFRFRVRDGRVEVREIEQAALA